MAVLGALTMLALVAAFTLANTVYKAEPLSAQEEQQFWDAYELLGDAVEGTPAQQVARENAQRQRSYLALVDCLEEIDAEQAAGRLQPPTLMTEAAGNDWHSLRLFDVHGFDPLQKEAGRHTEYVIAQIDDWAAFRETPDVDGCPEQDAAALADYPTDVAEALISDAIYGLGPWQQWFDGVDSDVSAAHYDCERASESRDIPNLNPRDLHARFREIWEDAAPGTPEERQAVREQLLALEQEWLDRDIACREPFLKEWMRVHGRHFTRQMLYNYESTGKLQQYWAQFEAEGEPGSTTEPEPERTASSVP